MNRKSTKQSRGKTAQEKAWQGWLKHQPCSFCDAPGPSIVDHCKGGSYKQNKIQIGELFCNSKCYGCDQIATIGNRSDLFSHGWTDSKATLWQLAKYREETRISFSNAERDAIKAVYAVNQDLTDWMSKL